MWGFDFEFQSWWNVLPFTIVHSSCGSQRLIRLLLWRKIHKLLHHLSGSSVLALSSSHNIQSSFRLNRQTFFSVTLGIQQSKSPVTKAQTVLMNPQFIDHNAVDCWTTDSQQLLNDYPILITNDCPVALGNHIWTAVWLPLLATTFLCPCCLNEIFHFGKQQWQNSHKAKSRKETNRTYLSAHRLQNIF